MTKFQIGAQMYSMRDRTQTAEAMRRALTEVKNMGYNLVQLSGHNQQIDPNEIADMLKSIGLTCGSTHFGFDVLRDETARLAQVHHLWGCSYPGIGAMPDRYRTSKDGYIAFAKDVSEVADRLADEGLHLVYHNHAFEMAKFDGVTGLELLMEHSSPSLQFEVDTYWIQSGGGDPCEWIRRVAGRMDVVHFKEMVGCEPTNGSMTKMAPVGEGNLNWPKIFAACEEIGVKYAFVEQDNAVETESCACMKRSHDNLVKLGGSF